MSGARLDIDFSLTPPVGWDAFVNQFPQHRLYHTSRWNEMIRETFGHQPYYIVLKRGDAWVGCLPLIYLKSVLFGKLLVSLPFVNYGGPLLISDDLFNPLGDYLQEFRKELDAAHVELRMETQLHTTNLQVKTHKVTYYLDLPADDEELWKSFKAKLRSQVRRPLKENMFTRTGGLELVNDFYKVFAHNMRDLGTPVYSKLFFKNILRNFPDQAFVVVVYSNDDIPVAASFLIRHGDIMEIPWASSIRAYNRFSPNMLLYWESFRLAIEKGCRRFDFGRCTPGSGTCKFKRQWGAQEVPLFWYYALPEGETLPEISPQNKKFDVMVKVWQKMPLFFTNTLGPHIIRNIPG